MLETPKDIFSCEYCEIFKSIYFEEHLQMAAYMAYLLYYRLNNKPWLYLFFFYCDCWKADLEDSSEFW